MPNIMSLGACFKKIHLVLETEDSKVKVLASAKNLRNKKDGGLDKIFMHQDLTPKQRQARKLLVEELKDRRANGEENLMILNGKVVTRRQQGMETSVQAPQVEMFLHECRPNIRKDD